MKKLNAFQLKIICVILMVLDHIDPFVPNMVSAIAHVISRVVSPIFAYFVVEGLFYTRNLKKYNLRLWSWAIVMAVGNNIINTIYSTKQIHVYNNIFMTLACGLTMLTFIHCGRKVEKVRENRFKKVGFYVLAILVAAFGMIQEGAQVVLPVMLISYFFRDSNKKKYIGYSILSILLFSMSFVDYGNLKDTLLMLAYNSDFMFILALPLLGMYNGLRGPNTKFNKYFFYIFYPLHLWIIATLQYWRG